MDYRLRCSGMTLLGKRKSRNLFSATSVTSPAQLRMMNGLCSSIKVSGSDSFGGEAAIAKFTKLCSITFRQRRDRTSC
jgi:hypothetical protein